MGVRGRQTYLELQNLMVGCFLIHKIYGLFTGCVLLGVLFSQTQLRIVGG